MKAIVRLFYVLMASVSMMVAHQSVAQPLEIDIVGGGQGGIPIAVVPFGNGESLPENVSAIIHANLKRSGRFEVLPESGLVSRPTIAADVSLKDWRLVRTDAVVVGRIQPEGAGYRISYDLVNVNGGNVIDTYSLIAPEALLRKAAHQISDRIYLAMTGIRGAFDTRLAYITVEGGFKSRTYFLMVADSDGFNSQTILKSTDPVVSPTWSHDGNYLAYNTLGKKQSTIYVQNISAATREAVAQYKGINSAPDFSPDGRSMAMTLSKDGNAEIYVMDLASKNLTRITSNRGSDTEPSFSPDGRSILFTSDRSGKPQIYRVGAGGGEAQRLTFQGKYNSNATYSPDGSKIAFVTEQGRGYQIAVMKSSGGGFTTISPGKLDESPSYAPNGEMVVYSTKKGNSGVLSVVSEGGRSSHELKFKSGDVREPAWSPFRK